MNRLPPPCPMTRQIAGFALHALEPDEELAVLAHLPRCTACTAALRAHDEVLARLGSETIVLRPPAHLRECILAAASAAAPESPVSPVTLVSPAPRTGKAIWSGPATIDRAVAPRDAGPTARPTEPAHRARRRRRLAGALLAAAATVAVGVLAGQTAGLQAQRDTVVAQSRDLAGIVTGLDAPGSAHATLLDGHGTPLAAVVTDPTALHLVVADLPGNDASSSVYVLWGTGAGAPAAIGTFDAATGRTDVHTLPPASPGFTGYAISHEHGHTAPVTPTEIVASGILAT